MTQQELADAAGVDLKTVYNLESGSRWPIAKTRAAISAALQWEADALSVIADGDVPPARAAAPDPLAAFGPPPRGRRLRALEDSDEPGLVPYLAEVAAEVSRAMDEHGPDLTGAQAFPGRPEDQGYWDSPRLSGYERVRLVARMRRMSAEGGSGQRDRRVSGLAPWHAPGAVPAARYRAAGIT